MQIYIQKNGQNIGPFSIEQVNELIGQGQLVHSDLAFHDGLTNWVPLSNIDGTLFPPGAQLALPASPNMPSTQIGTLGPAQHSHPAQTPTVVIAGNPSPQSGEGSMSKGFGSMFGGCMGIAIAVAVVGLVLIVGCYACSSAAVSEMENSIEESENNGF